MPRTIYFVAGEASGDNHGAALISALRELDPALQFPGRGGPQMKALAGAGFRDWIDEAAVVGLWEVIKNYSYFRKQFRDTLAEISEARPDAIVLIDYPGFNLRLARALRDRSIGRKVIYYISPQVWAWNRGRIGHMALCVDLMLCIFPFETDLYNRSGLRARFVGHPMIERLRTKKIGAPRDPSLIGLFPGSRLREVRKILPIMIEAARVLRRQKPELRFIVAAASPRLAEVIKVLLGSESFEVSVGDSAGLMQRAIAGIIASGSASLEAAYFRLPFVLVYKVSWVTYVAARLVVKVDYLGMPNLLAGKEIVPEFIQHRAKPAAIANSVLRLIGNTGAREEMLSDFDKIMSSLGKEGASMEAARAIIQELADERR